MNRIGYLALCFGLIVFWWTGIYWRNLQRVIDKRPAVVQQSEQKTKHKYRLASEYKTMEKLYLCMKNKTPRLDMHPGLAQASLAPLKRMLEWS